MVLRDHAVGLITAIFLLRVIPKAGKGALFYLWIDKPLLRDFLP